MFETKYLDIAEELESKIDRGQWESRLPGVAVLSRELSANPRTITKALQVLSRKGRVTIKASSGTFINQDHNARQRYYTIGVLGLLHNQKKQVELMDVEEMARKRGYHVLSIEHCNELLEKNPDILQQMPVDGFIFANSTLTCDVATSLCKAGVPFVSVNRVSAIDGVNWVDFDNEKGYGEVFQRLLELGHRRIAFLGFKTNMEEHAVRMERVYRDALQQAGCYDPSLYLHHDDAGEYYSRYREQYGAILGMEKAGYLMSMEYRPTAILTTCPAIAHGFCRQVEMMGMKVPDHVSVAAICQRRQDADRETFLSVLAGSVRKRARLATETLLQKIDEPGGDTIQEFLGMDFILRGSVGPCNS